jgi:phage portal protein BeeE
MDLSPRGAFVEYSRLNSGEIESLTLLPPGSTKPIPNAASFVSGYEVTIGASKVERPASSVLWFRNPHPTDPYRSMTPLEAAGMAIDTDWLAAVYNATFMKNDGRPGGIIAVDTAGGSMLPEDADEMKSYFKGTERVGEWRVIEASGMSVADMAAQPREAGWLEARGASKSEIMAAFFTPPTTDRRHRGPHVRQRRR